MDDSENESDFERSLAHQRTMQCLHLHSYFKYACEPINIGSSFFVCAGRINAVHVNAAEGSAIRVVSSYEILKYTFIDGQMFDGIKADLIQQHWLYVI